MDTEPLQGSQDSFPVYVYRWSKFGPIGADKGSLRITPDLVTLTITKNNRGFACKPSELTINEATMPIFGLSTPAGNFDVAEGEHRWSLSTWAWFSKKRRHRAGVLLKRFAQVGVDLTPYLAKVAAT